LSTLEHGGGVLPLRLYRGKAYSGMDERKDTEQANAPAQQSGHDDLYRDIIELLPVGVALRDESGRVVLANGIAAAEMGLGEPRLDCPWAESSGGETPRRGPTLMPDMEALSTEDDVEGPAGKRTLLTAHKPVRVRGRDLLLSASLDITERKRAEDELVRRAYFDELTGLANRTLIQEHVEDVFARQGQDAPGRFALAFIDLDNFKHINDYFSHAIGDALLVQVARRIAGRIRSTDMLARISGDEFVLLIDPVESEAQLRGVIEGILDDIKRPFQLEAFEVFTSASIGVSIFPEHGRSYETLRRNADNAMYRAKTDSKGGAAFYDLNMGRSVTARMELEQRLRLAIRDRRFCCAFQPKVDIRSEEVIGFEALVRWRDDRGNINPPGDFVGLAIELGLIDPITHFVLAEIAESIEQLDEAFGAGTTMSINVAAKQAGDPTFMRSFTAALQATGHVERFMLEITEDALLAKNHFQTQVLPMLRDVGVRVSIDDFGTGYSSLAVLADLTVDEVKVDRSFITDIHQRPRSQSVLKTIESLAHGLGMSIVAEGVETFEEVAYLQAATQIRHAQGYYFSKPFFVEDFAQSRLAGGGGRAVATNRERPELRLSRTPRMAAEAPWRR
jgi:diguanylate cyclase (GGDEF)-like protein